MTILSHLAPIESGLGMYSFPDAARYIGASSRELRRWILGYEHGREEDRKFSEPLWTSQLAEFGVEGIGFRDLIELRFVHAFRDSGVPLQVIRSTLEAARTDLDEEFPLTSQKFRTDGRRIFLESVAASGDVQLLDILRKQHVIERVIGPSLRSGIEFDAKGATRWFPSKSRQVVLDPKRKCGEPILTESGVPTAAVVTALKAEGGDVKRVAKYFEISIQAVKRAAEFESQGSI